MEKLIQHFLYSIPYKTTLHGRSKGESLPEEKYDGPILLFVEDLLDHWISAADVHHNRGS